MKTICADHLIIQKIQETIENFNALLQNREYVDSICEAAKLIIEAMRSGNKLLICGNGGSAADSQHMAGEFMCRFYKDRYPMSAIALSTDTSVLTAISNDYSFGEVFSRQVIGLGRSGDVLLGISTSGNSNNVLQAIKIAKSMKIRTILLIGNKENDMANACDVVIRTPSIDTPRIQEMHLFIEHMICEIVEREMIEH